MSENENSSSAQTENSRLPRQYSFLTPDHNFISGPNASSSNPRDWNFFPTGIVYKFDTPKFHTPKFDTPKFDTPKFDTPKFSHGGNQKIDFQSLPGNISGCVSGNIVKGGSQINHNITVYFENKKLQEEVLNELHIIKLEVKEMGEKLAKVNEENERNRKRYYERNSEVKDPSNKKLKGENDLLKKNLAKNSKDIQGIKAIVKDNLPKNKFDGSLDETFEHKTSDTQMERKENSLCCIT